MVGDGYVAMRYRLGLPVVHEGAAPVSLFWLLDALTAVGVPDAAQSAAFWPLIAASVMVTELASALANHMLDGQPTDQASGGTSHVLIAAGVPLIVTMATRSH